MEKTVIHPTSTPRPIIFISILIIATNLFLSLGIIFLLTKFEPFPFMQQLGNNLRRGTILGFPVIPAMTAYMIIETIVAIGLLKNKRWSLYIFVLLVVYSVASAVYAHASLITILFGFDLYACIIAFIYRKRLT